MSQEHAEIVRKAFHLFNQTAFDRPSEPDLGLLDPDVTFDNSNAALDSAVYRGHDDFRELLSLLQGMWEHQRLEPEEFIPVGKDQVISPFGSSAPAGARLRRSPTRPSSGHCAAARSPT